MKRLSSLIIALAGVAWLAGCQTQPMRKQPQLSLPDVVQKINANNEKIPTLWARINLDAEVRNPENGKVTKVFANGGNLHYRAPNELRLWAKKDIAGLLLDLGINTERYWLIAPEPGPDMMWWGYVQTEPRQSEIPLRPQDLLEVLAIRPIQPTGPDAPRLRYSDKDRAYVLSWYHQNANRVTVSRQIFYDQETLLPGTVLLFTADGALALRARLSEHIEIESPTAPKPRMAGKYQLLLPESRSKATLRVMRMQLSNDGAPNDASFRFPQKRTVAKEKQIDAQVSK